MQIAREHGIRFFETSAKANINIEKAFLTLAEDILRKVRVAGGGSPSGPRELRRSPSNGSALSLHRRP